MIASLCFFLELQDRDGQPDSRGQKAFALADEEGIVRSFAALALGKIGAAERDVIPELRKIAGSDADASARKTALEAIEKLERD